MSGASDLTDEQLRSLYAWIDAIPLSRPKRNITRDFSDGLMLAEVVAAYFPQLVELHNYSPASSIQAKIYNFDTLNQKVLRRFGYQLTRGNIEDIVNCRAGVVESVLNTLQYKMAKYREKKSNQEENQDEQSTAGPSRASSQASTSATPPPAKNTQGVSPAPSNSKPKHSVIATVDEELLLEKEQRIKDLEETVEILELKIVKLEQLVRLKDSKIQKLQQRL